MGETSQLVQMQLRKAHMNRTWLPLKSLSAQPELALEPSVGVSQHDGRNYLAISEVRLVEKQRTPPGP